MRGGKREGAGAPKKPAHLKKKVVSLALPGWILAELGKLEESRNVIIEKALLEKYKWELDK